MVLRPGEIGHVAFWNVFSGKKKTPQELMAAGNYKASLKGFEELLKTRKSDPVLFMNVADLYMKMGHKDKARKYYIKVGEFYGEQGFFNKAVAVFKKALNITPGDKEILKKLASYNNKVPKYILDSSFLQRAGDNNANKPVEPKPEPVQERELVQETEPVQEVDPVPEALAEQEAEAVQEPHAVIELGPGEPAQELSEDTEPVVESDRTIPDPVSTVVEDTDDSGDYDGIDFDTLTDLSEELTEEFENTNFPLASGQRVPAQPTAPVEEVSPEHTESVQADETPEPSQEEVNLGLTPDNIVFSSRPMEMNNDSDGFDMDMDFSSLDDALDSLFAPETPVNQQEQHRKHWALFRTMPEEMFMDFVIALETRDFEPGVYIVEQGNPGDEMYLIADGEVEVLLNRGESQDRVATLRGGDFFGEASLLTGAPRNATVKTLTTTNCLLLKQAHLHELAKSHPSVTQSIESIYQARLRQNAGD